MLESAIALRPFLQWQLSKRTQPLYLRRLLLRSSVKRKLGERHDLGVTTSSCVFGCTLGNMVSHLLLPRARKAHVLTLIAEQLKRMSALLARSSGPDVDRLGRGLAAGYVVRSQLRRLPELAQIKLDCRYGNTGTAIGATASVLTAIGILLNKGNCEWFHKRAVLLSALVRSEAYLTDWHSRSSDVDALAVLACERRAIARAVRGVEVAILIATEMGLDEMGSMRLQLRTAMRAAFAPTHLSLNTQDEILASIERRELVFDEAPLPFFKEKRLVPEAADFVPLSELVIKSGDGVGSSSSSGSSSGIVSSISNSDTSEFDEVETGSGCFETDNWEMVDCMQI